MNKKFIKILMILVMVLALVGCSTETVTPEEVPQGIPPIDDPAISGPALEEELALTLDELSEYNGENGMPAYVAVDGIIYDVTDVSYWKGGAHNGFTAGNDLTEEIKNISPHGTSKLDGVPVVGKLVE